MAAERAGDWPAPLELPAGDVATGMLLQMAHRSSHQRLAAALAPLGLAVRDFGVLAFLARGPLRQRQLIDVLGVDKSTMVRVVDHLERQGLLVRRRDRHDRRAYAVELTDHGRQRLDAAHAATRDLGAHLFGWLSDQDRRRLHATLHRIIQAARSP
jgi:DNA-binding MarR family transcriptional regulator